MEGLDERWVGQALQLRVFLTAAAYVLMQELRLRAARTSLAHAQVSTLRDCLLKIGTQFFRNRRMMSLYMRLLPAFSPLLYHTLRTSGARGFGIGSNSRPRTHAEIDVPTTGSFLSFLKVK